MENQNHVSEDFILESRCYQASGTRGVHIGLVTEIDYDKNQTDRQSVAGDIIRRGCFISPDCEWGIMDTPVVEPADEMRG